MILIGADTHKRTHALAATEQGAIARAVLREGIEQFPTAFLDEEAMEIRLLCDHREILVGERMRLINRLRWNLVILDPELEAKIPSRKLDYPGQLQRITRRLPAAIFDWTAAGARAVVGAWGVA